MGDCESVWIESKLELQLEQDSLHINLHQTRILLKLPLEPDELTVASTHAGRLRCKGFTVGLGMKKVNTLHSTVLDDTETKYEAM